MADSIRVLLVDHPRLFRHCLAQVLGCRRRLRIVGEAESRSEALAVARQTRPDVIVVDPRIGGPGESLISELCGEAPGAAVLVLSQESEPGFIARALQDGARGYLQKECDVDELAQSIERVFAGELVLCPALTSPALQSLASGQTLAGLTRRELDLLPLIAQGQTNQQIAHVLCITEHTVKAHLARILRKLGLGNRVQLASYAARHGMADLFRASA
jgi:DNA-binding NarL/FixJ family response regulator